MTSLLLMIFVPILTENFPEVMRCWLEFIIALLSDHDAFHIKGEIIALLPFQIIWHKCKNISHNLIVRSLVVRHLEPQTIHCRVLGSWNMHKYGAKLQSRRNACSLLPQIGVDCSIVHEVLMIRVDPDLAPPNYLLEVLARLDRHQ